MTGRERVLAALHHREADRVAIQDAPWETTVERWHREGLPEHESPTSYFGYELRRLGADVSLRMPARVVEETDDYTIAWDREGVLSKVWKHATSTPDMLDYTIKSSADWFAHKQDLQVTSDRIPWEAGLAAQRAARQQGLWFGYFAHTGYDKTQRIVGSENLLRAMLLEPDWVADMFMTAAEMIVQTAELMMEGGLQFDGAFIADDMGYRNGPLFSPRVYRDLCLPAHKRICDLFHRYGLKVILHSCGNVSRLIPHLLEAGFDCLQPLEVKAGMDLLALKEQYGQTLAFMGGIDVRKMADPDPRPIEEEIRVKVGLAKRGGGYIYHSDHSVPDNVSFERYHYVMDLIQKHGQF